MKILKLKQSQVLQLKATLSAVRDHQDYLRQVADLSPQAAENLVVAAIMGITLASALNELINTETP